nr:immunoglobulin heavy chain junction region [Macaca mulatta]
CIRDGYGSGLDYW